MACSVVLDAVWDSRSENSPVLRLFGELDGFSGADVLEAIPVADVPSKLVVDLTGVTFINAGGISALLRMRRRWQDAGGSFALRGARGIVRRVLEITDLEFLWEETKR